MRLGRPLVAGTFIQRDNRFRATVEVRGQPVWAYVPNSGRLEKLLVLGRPVLLRKADLSPRKTKYDLLLVKLGQALVSVDARLCLTICSMKPLQPAKCRNSFRKRVKGDVPHWGQTGS